jgi:hypothetical protein
MRVFSGGAKVRGGTVHGDEDWGLDFGWEVGFLFWDGPHAQACFEHFWGQFKKSITAIFSGTFTERGNIFYFSSV